MTSPQILVLDNPNEIQFYQLLTWRAALRLEVLGMTRHGRQVSVIVRDQLGFTGTKKEILAKLDKHIEEKRASALV